MIGRLSNNMKFEEAFNELLKGKKIRRKVRKKECFLERVGDEIWDEKTFPREERWYRSCFEIYDFTANDWEIMEGE